MMKMALGWRCLLWRLGRLLLGRGFLLLATGGTLLAVALAFLLTQPLFLLSFQPLFLLAFFLLFFLFQLFGFLLGLGLGTLFFLFAALLGTQLALLVLTTFGFQFALFFGAQDGCFVLFSAIGEFGLERCGRLVIIWNDHGFAVPRAAARRFVSLGRSGLGAGLALLLVLLAQRLVVAGSLGHAHIVGAVVQGLALDTEAEPVFLVAELLPVGGVGHVPIAHGLDVVIAGHQLVDLVAHFLAVQAVGAVQEIGHLAPFALLRHVGSTGRVVILKVVAAHERLVHDLGKIPFPLGFLLCGLCRHGQREASHQAQEYDFYSHLAKL